MLWRLSEETKATSGVTPGHPSFGMILRDSMLLVRGLDADGAFARLISPLA
ncbi:MAG: hypothetical protein M1815_002875 [Lichina confinis]|nr:MAG: hypothetical protein M1815_002875 [Lichina confinis]